MGYSETLEPAADAWRVAVRNYNSGAVIGCLVRVVETHGNRLISDWQGGSTCTTGAVCNPDALVHATHYAAPSLNRRMRARRQWPIGVR